MDCPFDCSKFYVNLHVFYSLAFIRYKDREYTFDKAGRLLWIMNNNRKIERSLNNRFVEKWEMGDDHIYRKKRIIDNAQAEAIYNKIIQDVTEIHTILKSKPGCYNKCGMYYNSDEIIAFIEKVISSGYSSALADKTQFDSIYNHIEIIPNDLTFPLIIQLTEGCAYNKCSFCLFYKNTRFRMKNLDEVKEHIRQIKLFLDKSIENKYTIFLGDANALMIPQDILITMFDLINNELEIKSWENNFEKSLQYSYFMREEEINQHRFEGIYSFIDAYYGKEKSIKDFKELKERNLRRVYIGMESGSNRLLSFVKKCNSIQDSINLITTIKEAKIPVGIMLITGLGGDKFYSEHVNETIKALNTLPLDSGDSIYFSHLTQHEKTQYEKDSKENGINRLSYEEENDQKELIVQGLRFPPENSPHIKGYEIEYVRF
ncbi:MAG: radical SAM protein [bacterium]